MDFGGRKEIFRALTGSHNYNMNTPESDKDYKIFVAPTFDDLYSNQEFSKSYLKIDYNNEKCDFDVHDIRKVSSLWWKANVNFLEVLFSNEFLILNESNYSKTNCLVAEIYKLKNKIARINLPYLYDACIGMHLNKKKLINKGTEGTQHLVDKYSFDTKQAMHSLRILDFLHRFAQTDFEDFKYAISYNMDDTQDWYGKYLLSIKHGELSKEEYLKTAEQEKQWIEDNFKHIYKEQPIDHNTYEDLIEIVKEIVKINL